ncbi:MULTISPECIES: PsiF family protein [Thiomonas]|uniref:PsiF family protein n=1 Tax=Thiomonas TaxID=32012 RepID=UPI000B8EA985|nr:MULTISPECIES: PsiF family protein [Thiomonas]
MISTTSSRKQMSQALRPLLAACILAAVGGASAWAADPGSNSQPLGAPPAAMQGQAPGGGGGAVSGNKEATCAAQAKQQGLKGQQRQQFIQQCMQG